MATVLPVDDSRHAFEISGRSRQWLSYLKTEVFFCVDLVADIESLEFSLLEAAPKSPLYLALFNRTKNWPIFVLSIMLINLIFFIWGIFSIGYSNANISLTIPISPPYSTYPFMTVNPWPSCSDARGNSWRLVSSQFAHAGILHLGVNTFIGLIYGIILEVSHPYHWLIAIIVFELGIIMGNLSFSYLLPFDVTVGCSSGIYGWIGCCISHLVLNKNIINRTMYYTLMTLLIIQGICDLSLYFFRYNTGTAYAAHFGGFFTGIFIGLSFGMLEKPRWKRIIGLLGFLAFLVMGISLIVHYLKSWPPQFLAYNPTFHS